MDCSMELTINKSFQKAVEVHKLGKLEEAERLYKRILQAHPKHPDTNHSMGELFVGVGKVKEALSFFKVALEANPSRIEFWLSYIDALIQLGRIIDAKTVLNQIKGEGASTKAFDLLEQRLNGKNEAHLVDDSNAGAQNKTTTNILDRLKLDQAIRLAKKKIKEGWPEDAKGIYQDILTKFPKNKRAIDGMSALLRGAVGQVSKVQEPSQYQQQQLIKLYKHGQHQEALDTAKQLLLTFRSSVTLYSICGAANAALGQHDAAIISYENSLKINPDLADTYYNMGKVYYHMGVYLQSKADLNKAIGRFKKVLEIEPRHLKAHFSMGNALKDKGDLGAAKGYYQQALKIYPDYAEAHNNMGLVLQDQGDVKAAICSYKEALRINPEFINAYSNMGVALMAESDADGALSSFKQALKIKPNYAEAHNNMGLVSYSQGDLKAAIESFSKAIKAKSDYADPYNNMGNVLMDQGDVNAALDSYKQALKIMPGQADAHNNMGLILFDKGDLEAAIGSYNKALKIKPNHADAYSNLGNALKEKGDLKAAKDAYEWAIKYKQDHASANFNLGLLLLESSHNNKAAEHFNLSALELSKHYFLRCLYLEDKKTLFYGQLDDLINQSEVHPIIGSLVCRAALKYGIERPNLFCEDPLSYVLKTELLDGYDFEGVFVKPTRTILGENRLPLRSQGLLTNGKQTLGDLFSLEPNLAANMEKIIRAEVDKYQVYFKDSKEGLITNWPTDYNIKGWLVSMKSGGELQPHMHENGWISGSVYINVPAKLKVDSGNLVVCIEKSSLTSNDLDQEKSINVTTGSLCLFPASLLHYTIPFESEEERIVLAFDVIPKRNRNPTSSV